MLQGMQLALVPLPCLQQGLGATQKSAMRIL